jgi:glycosyltransferase involved in cell wall biosynthesis
MKLLVIIPSMQCGGAERVASMLCNEWQREHEVILALFDCRAPAFNVAGKKVDLGASAASGWLRKLINPVLRVHRLRRLFQREQPDRIISFMESANFPTILAALLSGCLAKTIVSVHTNPLAIPWFHRGLIPVLYRLAGQVVAVSQGVANQLRRFGLPQRALCVIPNPLDLPVLHRRALEAPCPRLAGDQRFILGVGRLVRHKGFDRLIEAFSLLQIPDIRLIILGEGPERLNLQSQIESLGLSEKIWMPGEVRNPYPFYRLANCYVLSSRVEGFAIALLEAMASGCPVAAFNCDHGPGEIIEHGVNGMLVQEGQVELLAASITALLQDDVLANRIAEAGIRRASEYCISDIAKQWWALPLKKAVNQFGGISQDVQSEIIR